MFSHASGTRDVNTVVSHRRNAGLLSTIRCAAERIRTLTGNLTLSGKDMKAIVYHNYGSPDVLNCEEVDKPTPGDNEVLIRVRAASVNPLDWYSMRGKPYLIRIMTGLRKPKVTRPGVDVAGQVQAVRSNVKQFKPGDEVFGACRGTFAEYVCGVEDK